LAGIIFRNIEEVLRQCGTVASPLGPTIVLPVHLLRADRRFVEWTMTRPEEAPTTAAELFAEVEPLVRPFFDRFSSLDALHATLLDSESSSWLLLSPEQRQIKLAAIEHLEGGTDAAVSRLERALAERVGQPPKWRHELEKLLRYFRQLDEDPPLARP